MNKKYFFEVIDCERDLTNEELDAVEEAIAEILTRTVEFDHIYVNEE